MSWRLLGQAAWAAVPPQCSGRAPLPWGSCGVEGAVLSPRLRNWPCPSRLLGASARQALRLEVSALPGEAEP